MTEKVIAVVVTFNRKMLLLECIEALMGQKSNAELQILVVDNHSTDGTYSAIENYLIEGRIIYFDTGKNLGGAGGFQVGVDKARQYNPDYIWIMDDDCIPHDDALQQMLDFANEKQNVGQLGFISSKAVWTDGQLCLMNVQRHNIMKRVKNDEYSKRYIDAEYATFVSLFVPAKVVEDVGIPNGGFFIWGDDWDYTRRISKKYKSYVLPSSVVVHKMKSNSGGNIIDDDASRIERYQIGFRNKVYIARQEGIRGNLYLTLSVGKDMIMILLKSKDHKLDRISTMFKGLRVGRTFCPQPIVLDHIVNKENTNQIT